MATKEAKVMKGIDVSHWQGNIDFSKVKTDFAIIKAGGSDAGFYKDRKFEQNYAGFKSRKIPVGAYYFVGKKCKSRADGVADAKRFITMLKGKQFEMPVYIDFEAPDATFKEANTDACIGFCETMESAGYFVGIYASDISGFKERLNLTRLKPYSLWVARYGSAPKYVTNYGIHQDSSTGRVAGIAGNVDTDICYVDYPSVIKKKHFNGF